MDNTSKGDVSDLACEMDRHFTSNEAFGHAQSLATEQDRKSTVSRTQTEPKKAKTRNEHIRKLALESLSWIDQHRRILPTIPTSHLPSPRRATPAERRALKENFMRDMVASKDPFQPAENLTHPPAPLGIQDALAVGELPCSKTATPEELETPKEKLAKEADTNKAPDLTKPSFESQRSITIPGEIMLSALDAAAGDPNVKIRSDNCIWDTSAQFCSVSADLVTNLDPTFLESGIHDPYRVHSGVAVHVDAVLNMSNTTFGISTIFLVLPKENMPNKRTGIVLGQYRFMNRIVVEMVPRSILLKRKEKTDETKWGEIRIKAVLGLDDDLQECS